MIIIDPSFEIIAHTPEPVKLIEQAGRACYQSHDKTTADSATPFVERLMARKHESVLEHASVTVRLITDRGVTHELVRHRIASFSQESTRYCNYKGDLMFIKPWWFDAAEEPPRQAWLAAMEYAETHYNEMIDLKLAPQAARAILPNSLKSEIIVSANMREWRHIFGLRCSKAAHPDIRRIMLAALAGFVDRWPTLFSDLAAEYID